MPKFIRPDQVVISSRDGEVKMTIDMTITLNVNTGAISVSADARADGEEAVVPVKPPDFEWQLPDFGEDEKIEFGKKV